MVIWNRKWTCGAGLWVEYLSPRAINFVALLYSSPTGAAQSVTYVFFFAWHGGVFLSSHLLTHAFSGLPSLESGTEEAGEGGAE